MAEHFKSLAFEELSGHEAEEKCDHEKQTEHRNGAEREAEREEALGFGGSIIECMAECTHFRSPFR